MQKFALALIAFFLGGAVFAEGFPGQGDASAWSDALPHYNLGNRYLEKGRYDDAAEKFRDAISFYQYDPDFYSNLGLAYCKSSHYHEAEQAFKKAIELNNKDWMLWNNLAAAYLKQDRLLDTLHTFEKSLQCHPPANEAQKIHTDIKDIKKILTAQGILPVPGQPKPISLKVNKRIATKNTGAKPAPESKFNALSTPKADKNNLEKSGWDYLN